ncbi:MAG: GNAT family N-acetyltransferase [Promicromonosporaceae bacterium]|nr:GNAT family N-acetyltransferase [Promicromonosporaceae bacterium]
MTAVVRPLKPVEFGLLREFTHLAIHVSDSEGQPPISLVDDEPLLRQYWDGFGNQAGDVAVAAEMDGLVVGVAWSRLLIDPRGYGNLDTETPELAISVRPEFRGRGLGGQLLAALLQALGAAGWPRLSLSVDKRNPAMNLYRRAGFRKVAEQDDDYHMVAAPPRPP